MSERLEIYAGSVDEAKGKIGRIIRNILVSGWEQKRQKEFERRS